jgi:hypothetical protein
MFQIKKSLASFLLAGLFAFTTHAQEKPVELFGEGNGGHVKLLWVPKKWPQGLTAFQVMRRTVSNGDWTPVNAAPIVPELSRSKDLTNVESDPAALARLRSKLDQLLSSGKSKEVTRQDYLQRLSSDPDAVKGLYLPIALDYDFALLNGFGLVDRSAPAGGTYEYGLFLVLGNERQGQPAGVFTWKHGDRAGLSLPVDLKILKTGTPTQLEVRWEFDHQAYLARNVNGFNLYRRSGSGSQQKLNETPIWATAEGSPARLSFFDKNVQPGTVYTYAVAPLSLFGTEGQRQEATFDPSKLPGKVEPPVLRAVEQPAGRPGIQFTWDFQAASQNFIQGFVLQRRANVEAPYVNVSQQVPPTGRTISDTPPQAGEYYLYRLRVLDEFGLNLFSNELLVYYDPQIPPPPPTGLQGEFEKEGNRQFIRLTWNGKALGDTLTAGYRLYSNFPPDERLLLEGNIPVITGASYRYEIFSPGSAEYRFAVSAVSSRKAESGLSNVARVVTPSQKIPNTNIWPFSVEGNRITLNWEYDAPPDLAGFRIFQDGVQVADERQLGPPERQWVSPPLAFNTAYRFELQAVTTSGVTSKMSIARTITTGK